MSHQNPSHNHSPGDAELIEAVGKHLETHVGPSGCVFHEIVSFTVHVDVHTVPPSRRHPFVTLCTSGCAELPMTLPDGVGDECAYAEFCCTLPADWKLTAEDFKDERWYFPFRWLKSLARYPHENSTWLCYGHTVSGIGEPAPPDPRHPFRAVMLIPPFMLPPAFHKLQLPDRTVRIWQMIPLLEDEYTFARATDIDTFLSRMDALVDRIGFQELVSPKRPSILKT